MATQQTVALMDTSTYTNFASWAKWALAAFTTFGWIQTADYGQVNWTNLAASAAVPLSSNNSGWTSYQAAASVGTGAGGFAASGGSLIIAMATTTGMAAGKAVQLLALAGTGANAGVSAYNNYILTITSVVASTSITVACPAGWSFSYQVTAGTATIQPAFMIFVSNDTLTPTMPLYVKMEFGGYQSNNSPWARVTIGTAGTNGYGTLSGTTTAAMCFCCYQSDTVNWRPCIASGDSGNIRFCCFVPIGIGTYDPTLLCGW